MRYLVLTDIHANLEALDACLADAKGRGYDRVLVLGDLVGYGPDPNAVVDAVRDLRPAAMVRGNHDKVACGLEQPDDFNTVAKTAVVWTHAALTPENRAWLAALPMGPAVVDEAIEICHGSPFDEDTYIFDEGDARHALQTSTRRLCLFGHTHWPATYVRADNGDGYAELAPPENGRVALRDGMKHVINPGAVGQPRDNDPRAAYAIADTSQARVELFRVRYPVATTQAKIIKAGLPEALAARLGAGR